MMNLADIAAFGGFTLVAFLGGFALGVLIIEQRLDSLRYGGRP